MKGIFKKAAAVLLAVVLVCSLAAVIPASAAEKPFVLHVKSNLFPDRDFTYSNLSCLADDNGDVFLTVDFDMLAAQQYLINLDIGSLTWDTDVLEFKQAYNTYGTGRNARFVLFPFAYEQGLGTGIVNTFGDNNGGRLVGNYTSVSPAAYAYEEDGSAVTVVRATFKVIDSAAASAEIELTMREMSLCDDDVEEPYSQRKPVEHDAMQPDVCALLTLSTSITPINTGDVDGDGKVTINDATALQGFLAEMNSNIDWTDPKVLAQADANHDGRVDVRDVTEIQRYLANITTNL